tara:strand:- start:6 stop:233 length:228 start_codon:yes stop_codon:yes gene_type:complete
MKKKDLKSYKELNPLLNDLRVLINAITLLEFISHRFEILSRINFFLNEISKSSRMIATIKMIVKINESSISLGKE